MTVPHAKGKICILLAEDESAIRRLLSDTLTQEGFEVITAVDGADALRQARKHVGTINLLITDVKMPKLDGFDLRERLLQEQPDIKLLVISGNLDLEIKGIEFPLLRKPFLPSELAAKVRQILSA
jgi:two-component system, cell cycle sensor histidine kinase and response regulator CckA